eukprot:3689166-Pleurochrysis_carterae.AAC.1
MHVDTASDIDDDESAVDSNDMTEDDATLFAMFKASGLLASLKSEILCHNCLGWGHVKKHKSGKPVWPSAVKPRRPAIASTAFASSSSAATTAALVLLFLADIAIS